MLKIFKKIKKNKACSTNPQHNRGMTYVELIVVLSIFSIMSSIVIFNYGKFQAKINIKVLANDIALKIVQAQKESMAGKWPPVNKTPIAGWKPSYGVYFNRNDFSTSFIYFANLDNTGLISTDDLYSECVGKCLDYLTITKGITISDISYFSYGDPTPNNILNDLIITFTRPDSAPTVYLNDATKLSNFNYIQITISSPGDDPISAKIKLYSSGRIEIS